jgi:hypothetical protein
VEQVCSAVSGSTEKFNSIFGRLQRDLTSWPDYGALFAASNDDDAANGKENVYAETETLRATRFFGQNAS